MSEVDLIGWLASLVLLATLSWQIRDEWRSPASKGVSLWLFAGQTLASVGFIIYSALLENLVFIVTNSLILVTALIGQCVVWRNAREQDRSGRK